MSRATPLSPARALAGPAIALLIAAGVFLGLGTSPAQAAKPCWERVIDDWVDNDRIDGVYSAKCLQEAVKHLPEDVRAYSNFEDQVRQRRQEASRSTQGEEGLGGGAGRPRSGGTPVRPIEPNTGPRDEGPIQSVLGSGTTDADSIPLPLIILAALALLLMAAGASGLVARKLKARRLRG
jgi:hypothetical protein